MNQIVALLKSFKKIFKRRQKISTWYISYFIHQVSKTWVFNLRTHHNKVWCDKLMDTLLISQGKTTTSKFLKLINSLSLSLPLIWFNWNAAAPTKAKTQIDHPCHKTCCLGFLLWPFGQSFGMMQVLVLKKFGKAEQLLQA